MTPFRLALLNLLRRRVPTIIALTAIALSVACAGVLLRLYVLSGSRFQTLGRCGQAVVGAKAGGMDILLGSLNMEGPYPDFLPYVLCESLKSHADMRFEDGHRDEPNYIRTVIPFLYFAKYGEYRVVGTDEEFVQRGGAKDALLFESGSWPQSDDGVVLGWIVGRKENLKVGDTVVAQPWVADIKSTQNIDLRVTGILARTSTMWDRGCYARISKAHQVLEGMDLRNLSIWKQKVVNYLLFYIEKDGMVPLRTLVNRRTVGQAIDVEQERQRLEDLVGAGRRLGLVVTILILSLGALSVMVMMVTRFEAMTMQLAVLRAIGYRKREIGFWLLWEGLLLGATASILGGLVDAISFPWIRAAMGNALPAPYLVDSSVLQSAPVWIAAITATSAGVLVPLWRLYRLNVHAFLRST